MVRTYISSSFSIRLRWARNTPLFKSCILSNWCWCRTYWPCSIGLEHKDFEWVFNSTIFRSRWFNGHAGNGKTASIQSFTQEPFDVFNRNMAFDDLIAHKNRVASRDVCGNACCNAPYLKVWVIFHRDLKSCLLSQFVSAIDTQFRIFVDRWLFMFSFACFGELSWEICF